MSTSYHQELLVQCAWSSMHPPLQAFLEVTTYQGHISCVFVYNSAASGLTFQSPLIDQHCSKFEAQIEFSFNF